MFCEHQIQKSCKKIILGSFENNPVPVFTTLHFLRNFFTLGWKGLPGKNTLAYWAHL